MKAQIEAIHRRIETTATAAGRKPASVRLVAVSKTIPLSLIHI